MKEFSLRPLKWLASKLRPAPQRTYCRMCKRLLTNADSIARGIGPCCAGKKRRDDKTIDLFGPLDHDIAHPSDPS